MKKIRNILLVIAIIATFIGILLIGSSSNVIVGICFSVAAIGYFSVAVLNSKNKY